MQLETPPEPATTEDPQLLMQRLRLLRQGLVIGLLIFSLLLLLLSLYLIVASVRNDIARSLVNLSLAQDRLARATTPGPTVEALQATLTTTLSLANQLQAARPPLGVNWPVVVAALATYPPETIVLNALTQVDQSITLTGQAVNDLVVVDYAHTLEASPLFAAVVLQSLTQVTQPDAAAPAATPSATATNLGAGAVNFVIVIALNGQAS